MKLIIAGGRNYELTKADIAKLECLASDITEIVSGCASGADMWGEEWAKSKGIPIKRFPANWTNMGKDAVLRRRPDGTWYDCAAGPKRNMQMAEYAHAVALFPGGSGTNNMKKCAIKCGLTIYDFSTNEVMASKVAVWGAAKFNQWMDSRGIL